MKPHASKLIICHPTVAEQRGDHQRAGGQPCGGGGTHRRAQEGIGSED